MKDRFLNIKKSVLASLFLLIIGGLIVNSTFFLHSHKNDNGKIVFHAHPFDQGTETENPLSQHEHNKIDLDHLSSFDFYTFSQDLVNLDFNIKFELKVLSKPCFVSNSCDYSLNTTRGPPQESTLV